jgi:hypothetical protein
LAIGPNGVRLTDPVRPTVLDGRSRAAGAIPLAVHLLIPMQVMIFGRREYDPAQFAFAFFPLGVGHLFAFGFAPGGQGAAKLLNVFAMVAILALLADIVRSCCGGRYAELGMLLLLSLPIALLSTSNARRNQSRQVIGAHLIVAIRPHDDVVAVFQRGTR